MTYASPFGALVSSAIDVRVKTIDFTPKHSANNHRKACETLHQWAFEG